MRRAQKQIRQMDRWANECPPNFLGKLNLVRAEWASLWKENDRAYRKYISAISLLKESGFFFQTALANELAGKHFFRIKNERMGVQFLQKAIAKYTEWGGVAKSHHLEAELRSLQRK